MSVDRCFIYRCYCASTTMDACTREWWMHWTCTTRVSISWHHVKHSLYGRTIDQRLPGRIVSHINVSRYSKVAVIRYRFKNYVTAISTAFLTFTAERWTEADQQFHIILSIYLESQLNYRLQPIEVVRMCHLEITPTIITDHPRLRWDELKF